MNTRNIFIEQLRAGLVVTGYETFPNPGVLRTFQRIVPFTVESVEPVRGNYLVKGTDVNGAREEMLILSAHKVTVQIEKHRRLAFRPRNTVSHSL